MISSGKIYKSLFIPNCTRKIMWSRTYYWYTWKNFKMVKQKERMRITQSGKITPSIALSRASAWSESKRFDWPCVSLFDHWPTPMLGLLPLFALKNSFLHCFEKTKCTALNQSEWRNVFMYIIKARTWKVTNYFICNSNV